MKVLLTDGRYKHTLAAVRSLGRNGVYIGIVGKVGTYLSSYSRYVKSSFICPDPKRTKKFVYALKRICHEHKFDVILPVGYDSCVALSRYKDLLTPDINIPITDYNFFKVAADKNKTIQLARELNVPIPHTLTPYDENDIKQISKELSYPVVIKGLKESGRVKYVKNAVQLIDLCSYFHQLEGNYPLIQEYVQGDGYGFFALYNEGKLRAFFMHKRIKEMPVTGGASTMAMSIFEPKLKIYGERLLKALNWHGVAMVEFKKDQKTGEFKLMEINPKFWGSLDLAIASGVDFPYLISKMAVEGDVEKVCTYQLNVRFMWPFPGDLVRTFTLPSSFPRFLKDLMNPRVKKNFDLKDLKPISPMFKDTIRGLLLEGTRSLLPRIGFL